MQETREQNLFDPHTRGPSESDLRALAESKAVLLDLDGCLIFGSQVHPAASRLIEMLAGRHVIVSNNSTDTPLSMATALSRVGLAIDPNRIVLAGALMIDTLARESSEPVALFAGPKLEEYARSCDLPLVERGDDRTLARVAIARDTTLTYDDLNEILGLLSRGADLTVSNPDLTHPGANSAPVVETGAILALIRACIPDLQPRVIGKPEPMVFEAALARVGTMPERALMIGDNPNTDAAGALRMGMRCILVGPAGTYDSIEDLV